MTDAIRRALEQSGITTPLPEPPMYGMTVYEYMRNELTRALAVRLDRCMLGKRKCKELNGE